MALINKIREKSGIAVAVIAVALLLFIVGGDFFSQQSGGLLGGSNNKVGEIGGTDIDYQQFVKLVDTQRQQFELSSGRSTTEQELQQIRTQVWESLIQDYAYAPEYDALGIEVSPEELREMIQGTNNMHQYVRQQFTDPNTGQFNDAQHREFINAAANKTLTPEQQLLWNNFKTNLIQIRKNEKFQNLIGKTEFVSKIEAKKEYKIQNDKIDASYLYVPFYSINDTTVKVSDKMVSDYYSNHKNEYQGYDSRSFDYVVYQVVPAAEDSAALRDEINLLARGLAAAENPQAYANANSDERIPNSLSPNQLTPEVKSLLDNSIVGATVGPVKDGNNYSIYKYEGTERDSVQTARASHILIRADATAPDSVKAAARVKAQDILNQIKNGANFESLAQINGSDGTAQNGGDLGYFSNNGQMVKPFEDAIFGFRGTGLIPNLVTTDFGYHIIKVTDAPSNLRYKVAGITKVLSASEATQNEAYQKAEELRANVSNLEQLQAAIQKDPSLVLLSADRVNPAATNFNTIQNGREVVLWAFNENVKPGDVTDHVFVIDNNYIIAVLKSATDQEDPKASDFKDQIEFKVKNELKADIILKKLKAEGDLETIAKNYGAGALVESVSDINFQTGMLNSAGVDPIALGRAFGQKQGNRSKPFVGENGVYIMETTKKVLAPEIADYTPYKDQVIQRKGAFMAGSLADQAIRENADIIDRRAKMF